MEKPEEGAAALVTLVALAAKNGIAEPGKRNMDKHQLRVRWRCIIDELRHVPTDTIRSSTALFNI